MKKKLFACLLCLYFTLQGIVNMSAQVSIGGNSNQPKVPEAFSILELISVPTVKVGGLRLPQLTEADKTSISTQIDARASEAKGLFIYNSTKDCIEYWDGAKWVNPKGDEVTLPWQKAGSTEPSSKVLVTDSIYHNGSVVIGDVTKADDSAILDVKAGNRGVLLPRVALKGIDDTETIDNPAKGLLVYNTGAISTFSTEGYMFWNGTNWMLISNTLAIPASAILNCSAAQMAPSVQIVADKAISAGTVMQIPYTGSNGGFYQGVTITSSNGGGNITAKLPDGVLSPGNGFLNFAIEGTPTLDQQAPNGIKFNLSDLYSTNGGMRGIEDCNEAVIGAIVEAAVEVAAYMGTMVYVTDNTPNDSQTMPNINANNFTSWIANTNYGTSCWAFQGNTPDGNFSIRVRVPGNPDTVGPGGPINIQIRNNTGTPGALSSGRSANDAIHVIFNGNTEWGNGIIGNSGHIELPSKVWGGPQGDNGISSFTRNGWWGNGGIYDAAADGPEHRRHTWIPVGDDNYKVAYEALVMCAIDSKSASPVKPSKVKVYIKITQVTAR